MTSELRKRFLATLRTKYSSIKVAKQYEKAIYDRCGDHNYATLGYQLLGFFMNNVSPPNNVLKDTTNDVSHWDCSSFEGHKRVQMMDISRQIDGVKMEKGDYVCRNRLCRSDLCYYYLLQTRSADEGMTTFVVCSKCNTRYVAG